MLQASTFSGVHRGLEVFAQLTVNVGGAIIINSTRTVVAGAPSFPYRGLMVDTGPCSAVPIALGLSRSPSRSGFVVYLLHEAPTHHPLPHAHPSHTHTHARTRTRTRARTSPPLPAGGRAAQDAGRDGGVQPKCFPLAFDRCTSLPLELDRRTKACARCLP